MEHCRDQWQKAAGHRERTCCKHQGWSHLSRNQKHRSRLARRIWKYEEYSHSAGFATYERERGREDMPWILPSVVLQLNRTRVCWPRSHANTAHKVSPLKYKAGAEERVGLRKIGLRLTQYGECENITAMAARKYTSGHVLTHTCMMT